MGERLLGALLAMGTYLLGVQLLIPYGSTQQGPEGCQELPPWPVLDGQKYCQILPDALGSQPVNLQGEGGGD